MDNKDYSEKFEQFIKSTFFSVLTQEQQGFVKKQAVNYGFSFQELREFCVNVRDLSMWQERSIEKVFPSETSARVFQAKFGKKEKKDYLGKLNGYISQLKEKEKKYKNGTAYPRSFIKLVKAGSDRKVFGFCPVCSEKTHCCNLRVIDAVTGCPFSCNYCTIQTFYGDKAYVDANFDEKLSAIQLEKNKLYHIGTGQSSDSLVWGNKYGILDSLFKFAVKYPLAMVELKTKSSNIEHLLNNDVPKNIFCSWSLNPELIIENEEKGTASLKERLSAARKLCDKGMKVGFHFHPMMYYEGFAKDYDEICQEIFQNFDAKEILFVSIGTLTFIKPVIAAIRKRGGTSKVLQMPFTKDPHSKLSYPLTTKYKLYKQLYKSLASIREKVFMYLCMEEAFIWKEVFGYHYTNNEELEELLAQEIRAKLYSCE